MAADEQFSSSTEQKHTHFVKWAKERGVAINGVKPARIPHKGMGVVATRPLMVNALESNYGSHSNLELERRSDR
jgi:hypothetical protein